MEWFSNELIRLGLFSPTWSRNEYILKAHSFSTEFCHNVMRIILRPSHQSVPHWLGEMMSWITKLSFANLNPKFKNIGHLFNDVSDVNKKDNSLIFSKDILKSLYDQVKNEPYGNYKELRIDELETLFSSLYEIVKKKFNSYDELKSEVLEWIESLK